MLKQIYLFVFTMSMLLVSLDAVSANDDTSNETPQLTMMPATKVIVNLDEAEQEIKNKTHLPFVFPKQIPVTQNKQKYYASWFVDPAGKYYSISIDETPDCNGAKYCTVGSIAAAKGKQPKNYSAPLGGKVLTEQILLSGDHIGYYTPAHAEADYWPTMLEWHMDNALFTIRWKLDIDDEKRIIIKLANSAIQSI